MEQNYLTEAQIAEITDLATLFFTPKEIAVMLELDWNKFKFQVELPDSDAYKAFYSGRLQSEVDLRKSIIKLAKSGSSPAQTMALDLFNASKIKMIDK